MKFLFKETPFHFRSCLAASIRLLAYSLTASYEAWNPENKLYSWSMSHIRRCAMYDFTYISCDTTFVSPSSIFVDMAFWDFFSDNSFALSYDA